MHDDGRANVLRLPKKSRALMAALETRLPRRTKPVPYPVVILSAQSGDDLAVNFVAAFEERCARRHIRHCDPRGESDFDGLLTDLARGLAPGDDAARAFPRLTICRTVLDALKADPHADQRALLRTLYEGAAARHALFKFPAFIGELLPEPFARPIKVIFQEPLLRWIYGRWLRRTRALRWVPALTGDDRKFLAYLCSRSPDQLARYRRRILVEALLRDLQRQLRPSVYSVNFLRRHRPIVLLRRADAGSAQWAFVRECLAVLAPRDRARHPIRRTPLQIVAARGDEPSPDEVRLRSIDAGPNALAEAAEALTPSYPPAAGQDRATLLHVPVPGAEPDDTDAYWYRDTATEYRRDRWYDYLVPVTSALTTAAVVAAFMWFVPRLLSRHGACDGTWKPARSVERIGLTDGTCPLSDDAALRSVEATIASTNAQVARVHAQDPAHHPYRTIVFFSPLTVPPWGRPGSDSLDELRGVALAQRAVFKAARHDPSVVPIRVLLANAGDRFAWGPQVAKRIVDRARSDGSLSAVIGISQSRVESHEAIRRLSVLHVPIVGSTTTSDQILDSSPLYYQISPRDVREADTVAWFLRYEPVMAGPHGEKVMAGPHGEKVMADRAVVIEDPRDEYSQNIAEDFRDSFGPDRIVETYDFGPPEEGTPPHDPKGINDTPETTPAQLVHDVCTAIGQTPTIVFFASRAQQLTAMLDKVSAESACEGRQLALFGSDEETRFISDGTIGVSAYPAVHFYNAAFSDLSFVRTGVARQFAEDYRALYGAPAEDSGAADAYDAFSAASMAINAAYQQNPAFHPEVVATNMNLGVVSLNGVTGLISFRGAHDVTRVPVDKPIFIVYETPQGPETLLACGRFAAGAHGEWKTWGTGGKTFPCPHDAQR